MSGVSAAFIWRRRSCFHVLAGACQRAARPLTSQTAINTECRNPEIPLLMLSTYQNDCLYDPTLDQIMTQKKLTVSGGPVSSSQGFLLSVDRVADLNAVNPLTGARLILPPTASLPNFLGVVRDGINRELITDYVVILNGEDEDDDEDEEDEKITRMRRKKRMQWQTQRQMHGTVCLSTIMSGFFGKAILSPSLDTAVVIRDMSMDSYPTFHCKRYPEIMFARLGADASWATLSSPIGALTDVIFSKRDSRFIYAVDDSGTVAAFRLDHGSSSSSPAPVYVIEGPSLGHEEETEERMFLVESPDGGSLFLLQGVRAWGRHHTWSFKVFRLDSGGSGIDDSSGISKWEAVESIGDLAFFVGKIDSVSVSLPDPAAAAGDHGGIIRPNCIYFDTGGCNSRTAGVYSLESGVMKSSRQYELSDWERHIWLHPPPPFPFDP